MAADETMITQGLSLLKKISPDMKNSAPDLMSSIVNLKDDIIFCDTGKKAVIEEFTFFRQL